MVIFKGKIQGEYSLLPIKKHGEIQSCKIWTSVELLRVMA